jgi:hypothetical protein
MHERRTRKKAIQEKRDVVQRGYATRSIITSQEHPNLFQHMIDTIMVPQPQWFNRIGSIRSFRVVRGNKKRAFALRLLVQLETKRWVTISWRAAILSEFPNTKLQTCPIRAAMRQCVRTQVCAFRRFSKNQSATQTLSCRLCHRQDPQTVYHVDHEEPTFATLVLSFLDKPKNAAECPQASAMRYGRNGRRVFPPGYAQFSKRWKAFHKQKASLRILCCSCNLHRKRTNV